MMASNLLSRLLPPKPGAQSIYEVLQDEEASLEELDIEATAGMTTNGKVRGRLEDMARGGRESMAERQFDSHHGQADTMQPSERNIEPRHTALPKGKSRERRSKERKGKERKPETHQPEPEEADDDVPISLLIDMNQPGSPSHHGNDWLHTPGLIPIPITGRATGATRAKWLAAQEQQQLHQDRPRGNSGPTRPHQPLAIISPRESAMWQWANVQNLDNFLKDVYTYFLGHGIWSICLARMLNLLTSAFVVGFGLFLTSCIDYSKLRQSTALPEILVAQCTKKMSGWTNFLIWAFVFCWIAKFCENLVDIRRLKQMHDFYHHLLEVPDDDIQTISWQDIVKRLMALRDSNPTTAGNLTDQHRRFMGSQSKQRMDAHDIANRLMRRDNYLIALFNKDILDVTLPLPFLRDRPFFSKTLAWSLSLCISDYVFNDQGQVRPLFLKDSARRQLSDSLRRRFVVVGLLNIACAPFIIVYLMALYFFRYFNEYQRNPSQIGSRQYTPLAEWKFREFNELWHLFERRLNMSYPFASRYVDQFPKDKTVQVARFLAFLTGALAGVLALASVIDPEIFLNFEITPDRTVIFYLGVFGTVWAVLRGTVPEENLVFDPEYALNNVIDYTHYLPTEWRGRLHSHEVKKEFTQLYKLKVMIFVEEILSILTTPFVLIFSLPKCSDRLIDFVREFTVHVDGLGHVCSFAVFDFKKGAQAGPSTKPIRPAGANEGQGLRDDYYATRDGKMLASYYNFLDNYATNPKPGVPYLHPTRKPPFDPPPMPPPPAIPGLASALLGDRSDVWDRHASTGVQKRGARATATATAAAAAGAGTGFRTIISPIASILLDPSHQPSTHLLRSGIAHRPSAFAAQSRHRASRPPPTGTIPNDEDAHADAPSMQSPSAREEEVEESQLDDSWKTTRAAVPDDERGTNRGPGESGSGSGGGGGGVGGSGSGSGGAGGAGGTGVLGLMYQFSKAQTEGRAAMQI